MCKLLSSGSIVAAHDSMPTTQQAPTVVFQPPEMPITPLAQWMWMFTPEIAPKPEPATCTPEPKKCETVTTESMKTSRCAQASVLKYNCTRTGKLIELLTVSDSDAMACKPMQKEQLEQVKRAFSHLLRYCLRDGSTNWCEKASEQISNLYHKLQEGEIKQTTQQTLLEIATAINSKQYSTASKQIDALVSSDWASCKDWVVVAKSLIRVASDRQAVAMQVTDQNVRMQIKKETNHCSAAASSPEPISAQEFQEAKNALNALLHASLQDGSAKKNEQIAKHLNELFSKLRSGQMEYMVQEKVLGMVHAVRARAFAEAAKIVADLAVTNWDQNKEWLPGVRRLILEQK